MLYKCLYSKYRSLLKHDSNNKQNPGGSGGGRAILVDNTRKYPTTKLQRIDRKDRTTAMRREGDEHNFYPNVALCSWPTELVATKLPIFMEI